MAKALVFGDLALPPSSLGLAVAASSAVSAGIEAHGAAWRAVQLPDQAKLMQCAM